VTIDFLPDIPFLDWLDGKRKTEPKKMILSTLSQLLSNRFAQKVLDKTHIQQKNVVELSKKEMKNLHHFLKEFSFIPKSTAGYEKAEVTRGGVDTQNISSKTMESKLVPGLYFIGEVVDVTGLLGGFNFQWAWSSGWVAGQSIA